MYTLLMCDHIFETKLNTVYCGVWYNEIKLLLLTVDVLFQELVIVAEKVHL